MKGLPRLEENGKVVFPLGGRVILVSEFIANEGLAHVLGYDCPELVEMDDVLVLDDPGKGAVLLGVLDEVFLSKILVGPELRNFLFSTLFVVLLAINSLQLINKVGPRP